VDILRFTNPASPTLMHNAIIVDGFKTKMWVERYAEAGEFKFTADATPEMKNKLPIGSFVSHIDTGELMIVENHEINESGDRPELVITGRGYETYLEKRITGVLWDPATNARQDYTLAANYIWNQAVQLIKNHVDQATIFAAGHDVNDVIPYLDVRSSVPGGTDGENVVRTIKLGTLYERLLELLKIEQLGIRVTRPGWEFPTFFPGYTTFYIHKGVDRTAEVLFSVDAGEIESAEYLWSEKASRNVAVVAGQFIVVVVTYDPDLFIDPSGYIRRAMYLDASDIDGKYDVTALVGATRDDVINAMNRRGFAALAINNDVAITKVEISKNGTAAKFRTDFDVGDIVTVHGDYNLTTAMRVSEYVEIEDPSGNQGYPTLIPVEGD